MTGHLLCATFHETFGSRVVFHGIDGEPVLVPTSRLGVEERRPTEVDNSAAGRWLEGERVQFSLAS